MVQAILAIAFVSTSVGFHVLEEPAGKPSAEPEGTPLELSITGKVTKYTLDTGGLAGADYRKQAENGAKRGKPLAVPMVDLAIEIKNTSDKPVQVWTSGDPVVITLTLKGKGALNLNAALAFTQEFRLPKATEIAAGKSYVIPLKSLSSGFRGRSHVSYWTEPGDYELIAKLKTGVSPAPKGAKDGMDGFGVVTLTSAPFKLSVEEKK